MINEGNVGRIKDIKPSQFNSGFCTYKSVYIIVDLNVAPKNVLDSINKKIKRNGGTPPKINTSRERFLLMKNYEPYDGRADYDRCFFSTLQGVIDALKSKLNEGLKDKIKRSLKEDSVAQRGTRWNPDSQPNIYQLDIFLRKSGYRLVDVMNTEGRPEPIIESMKEGHLHPDITYSVADKTFYVEVKKYGELVASDLEEVIQGYQTALGVVKHLEGLDLNKLEYKESEDEE